MRTYYMYDGWEVIAKKDEEKQWMVLTFWEGDQEIGTMTIDVLGHRSISTHIYGIVSYPSHKGNGTKMIRFLSDVLHLEEASGDADPDSIPFWNHFQVSWDEDSFVLTL